MPPTSNKLWSRLVRALQKALRRQLADSSAAKIYPAALIAGAIGGIAPTVMRMVIKLTASPPRPITEGPIGYALALLVLAFVGSVVVWIWQEKRLQKAFYLGMGLPALIQVGGLQETALSETTAVSRPFSLVASAYAAEVPDSNAVPGRHLAITPRSKNPDFGVVFFGPDRKEFVTRTIRGAEPQTIDVPESAKAFAIRAESSLSSRMDLPAKAGATMAVVVEITAGKGSGFFQALGFERSGGYEIRVTLPDQAGTLSAAARAQFLNSVRNVQKKLRDVGAFTKEPDGVYGEETANAVGRYQSQQKIEADRLLGAETLNKLVGESAGQAFASAALQIELALHRKGLLTSQPNGALGPSTISAIRAFQKDRNLNADGALGLETLNALFSD